MQVGPSFSMPAGVEADGRAQINKTTTGAWPVGVLYCILYYSIRCVSKFKNSNRRTAAWLRSRYKLPVRCEHLDGCSVQRHASRELVYRTKYRYYVLSYVQALCHQVFIIAMSAISAMSVVHQSMGGGSTWKDGNIVLIPNKCRTPSRT